MNLYLLTQDVRQGYDTYDSVVVVAESAEEAQQIHPYARGAFEDGKSGELFSEQFWNSRTWADSYEDVEVEWIGLASGKLRKGVVLASFNAG